MNRRPLWLVLVGVVLFLVLGGPTPGSVGDCGAGESFADPVETCQNKKAWTCARRNARGDITMAEYDLCIAEISTSCAGAAWPLGCEPSQQQADSCIASLKDPDTLGTPGRCFPDAEACGVPPLIGIGCEPCDQPAQCNFCPASTPLIMSTDGGAGE